MTENISLEDLRNKLDTLGLPADVHNDVEIILNGMEAGKIDTPEYIDAWQRMYDRKVDALEKRPWDVRLMEDAKDLQALLQAISRQS